MRCRLTLFGVAWSTYSTLAVSQSSSGTPVEYVAAYIAGMCIALAAAAEAAAL